MKTLILAILLIPSLVYGGSLTLSWTASPEATGYKIFYGTDPAVLDTVIDVGNVTTYTVTDLIAGTTYYFRAKAFINEIGSSFSHGAFGVAELEKPTNLKVE